MGLNNQIAKPIITMQQAETIAAERPRPVQDNPSVRSAFGYHVRPRAWEGARCFIIGGGPSLKDFNFSLLKNELTIGINKAFLFFDPTIIFSMDARFWQWIEDGTLGTEAQQRFEHYKHGLKLFLNTGGSFFTPDILQVQHAGRIAFTDNFNHGIGSGNNSGYAALNLAATLGVTQIYLLGFDMHGDGKKQTWFHSGYPEVQSATVYDDFRHDIEKFAAPALAERGIEVINLSPSSALQCFPKAARDSFPRKSQPTVVSYFTEGTPYEQEVKYLTSSLRPFGLPRAICGVRSRGSWMANTQLKAKFLLEMMDTIEGPLLWLDADARMMAYPQTLVDLDREFDVAVHFKKGTELLSGTIYLANNERVRALLRDWADCCRANPDNFDQLSLQSIIMKHPVKVCPLPASYCAIYDGMPEAGEYPVIEHFQASRRFKYDVGVETNAFV